jgi:5-methylcytosine-specific restriction endonuclease McrA
MAKIRKSKRIQIRKFLYALNPNCIWCGQRMELRPKVNDIENAATIEHLVPSSQGGSNELYNLRLAHKRCNK